MIYRLEIENYYSIKNKQVIDLTVKRSTPDETGRLVPIYDGAKEYVPSTIAIYGANASGKSNILSVIPFWAVFLFSSFAQRPSAVFPYRKFQAREDVSSPSRISIFFSWCENPKKKTPTLPYIYTLVLPPRKKNDSDGKKPIAEESLFYAAHGGSNPELIFKRNNKGKVNLSSKIGNANDVKILEKILRPNASVISTLAQIDNSFAKNLIEHLSNYEFNIFMGATVSDGRPIEKIYGTEKPIFKEFIREIRRLDFGIEGAKLIKSGGYHQFQFTHSGLDEPMDIESESQGTVRFIKNFPMLHQALRSGGVVAIDEFDVAMHPYILPEILRWFYDPERNKKRAQLWANCHASSLMRGLLPEQVLVCEKDSMGETKVYRLADVEGVTPDEDIMQNYLDGIYGGVPTIG